MATSGPKEFHTYYFLVSMPKAISSQAEVKLDMKHQAVQPIRKVLDKDFKTANLEDFTVSVYAGDIIPSLLKEKEIKIVKNFMKTFPVKIALKLQKNKFEGKVNPDITVDCFIYFVKFEAMKKLIGKSIDPPPEIELLPFQYITLFSEALLAVDRKQMNDPTYLTFLRWGFNLIQSSPTVPFRLFLFIYEKIVHSGDLELLNNILDYFHLKKMQPPQTLEELTMFQEPLMMIYDDSVKYIDNIQKIPNVNLESYLIKFYTINIFYHATMKNLEKVFSYLLDIRDNNPYDKLMLAKLYLSEFNTFYKSIPINQEVKLSLIDCYIQASSSYENLLTSFSMITEYVQSDFNTILLIIIRNYEKINKICVDNNKPFKINDFIIQKYEDNLMDVQNSLIILGQNKLNFGFEAIDFRIDMWDMYLIEGNNPQFLEFLKSHLIQTSLYLTEIKKALTYINKYIQKDFVAMLDLFVKNYDKIEAICRIEKKYIEVDSYAVTSTHDNIHAIREHMDFIIGRKMKVNFETFYFKIDMWLFYINNNFNRDFLTYLEQKLFESALYYEDILDCLNFASTFRQKAFAPVLEVIINNFEKIHNFIYNKKVTIDFSKYLTQRIDIDNLEEIFNLLSTIIDKERIKNYRTVTFKINIWEPYSNIKNLNTLRFLRKIIIRLTVMDNTLTEKDIDLARKIHDIGFLYIRQGKLTGDKMLEFLGLEEAFYVEGQINDIIATNKYQQKQLDDHLNNINYLKQENIALKSRVGRCEDEINNLADENARLRGRVGSLESDVSSLYSRVRSLESDVSSLRFRS